MAVYTEVPDNELEEFVARYDSAALTTVDAVSALSA